MATSKPTPIGQCKLIDVRLSFPKFFTPEASVEGGPLKFGCSFLMHPDDEHYEANTERAQNAYDAVHAETWGGKKVVLKDDRKAYRAGETFTNQEGEMYAGYEDTMVVTASKQAAKGNKDPNDSAHNRLRPRLVTRGKVDVKEDDGLFYGGCRVDAVVNFYSVTEQKRGGNGIFATLELVRFRRDDTPFGAAPVDLDILEDLEDDEDDDSGI